MDVRVEEGTIQTAEADAIVVNLFQGVTTPGGATGALDDALDGAVREAIASGDLRGELGEVLVLYPRGSVPARRVLVAGLGPRETFGLEAVRVASAAAAKRCAAGGSTSLASIVHGAGIGGLDAERAAQATIEGALLALYRYQRSGGRQSAGIDRFTVIERDTARIPALERGARAAKAMAAGSQLARDLVHGPPNEVTPTRIAETAQALAEKHGLRVHVGDRAWMREQGMGALLAVAQGATEPPAFVTLELGAELEEAPIVLVGKGITFDSGGLSLKTRSGMVGMKSDMGGAAAVLGAMSTLAALGVPRRVIALLPCTENMPDGSAFRPSDVVRAANGKTIEIISTDAEGRLALADALVRAARWSPAAVIDIATLTSSCVRALGEGVAAGLFANDDELARRIDRAAEETFERTFRLPLYDDYRRAIDSDVADMKNSGGAKGGVGTSAAFLQEFVSYPWAHLDMAGMVISKKAKGYRPKGATGFGARLLAETVRRWSA